MWLTKQRAQPGNVFGHTDKFEGLGLFFDTYKNNRPGTVFPYIMAMNGDGQTAYDKDNDGKANEVAGCSVRPYTIPYLCPDENKEVVANKSCLGPRHPQRPSPHHRQTHLLPRRIPQTRAPIQVRRRMDNMLRYSQLQSPARRVPRFLR
jgi:hypothetical protein